MDRIPKPYDIFELWDDEVEFSPASSWFTTRHGPKMAAVHEKYRREINEDNRRHKKARSN